MLSPLRILAVDSATQVPLLSGTFTRLLFMVFVGPSGVGPLLTSKPHVQAFTYTHTHTRAHTRSATCKLERRRAPY